MQLGEVSVSLAHLVARALDARNVHAEPIMQPYTGWPLPDDGDARIGIARYMRLGHAAITASGDELFGLEMAAQIRPGDFLLPGLACACAPTLAAGLTLLCEAEALYSDNSRGHGHFERQATGGWLNFYSLAPYNAYNRFVVDSVLGGWWHLARQLSGDALSDASLEIDYTIPRSPEDSSPLPPSPGDMHEQTEKRWRWRYARRLGLPASQLHFATGRNRLWLPDRVLNAPTVQAAPVAFAQLRQQITERLESRQGPHDTLSRTRRAIAMRLSGRAPGRDEIAAALNLHPRTLARRLAAEGWHYEGLLDDTRRALAERYLRDTHLSLKEISWVLGFAGPESFQHACKRWHAKPPGAWRRQHRASSRTGSSRT
ncbi:AraC family transcriptional regulator ligand-binding domain-containing protein [Cobetia sp. 10Alg 146]|uniref:AraC family transcriptional regulator n=1 Tax=Cobetia sp. 10Alg 146 TaxID=3040019 RepID=UPI002446F930|nr:AraC family transcriptional regulator [Cobetia sp. 10Alg 146]MDH2291999.1 AraC family transcriptional regulator ligand-binding domain-containing protein [Cobetia sp. 10Alg 146]